MNFLYSTMGGHQSVPLQGPVALLGLAMTLPSWDTVIIIAEGADYPRMHLDWHDRRGPEGRNGFVLHCFETPESWGYFLAESLDFGKPEVRVELGGQSTENWPRQLFVPIELATQALEVFLESGKRAETLHWVRTDQVPREIL